MPNADHEPDETSPEDTYSWLYEDPAAGPTSGSAPGSSDQAPDASADAIPPMQLPPPSRGRSRGRSRSDGPGAPPPRTRRHKRRWPLVLGVLILAWIVFLVAVPIWAWSHVARVDASPNGDRPGDQPGTTYLLVGSDSRKGLSAAQKKKLATGPDGGGRGRTDTIMMMHVGSGPTLLMSIPRDSLVEIPGHGTTKINAAFSYGGPKLLVNTIEKSTGIRIDDYVEVGFGGFVNVVNALGGVQICPKKHIKDRDAGINLKKGCQKADGATALGYSRSRHTYASQDLQRVQSQRQVIGAIAKKAKSPWTILNPWRYYDVATGATSSIKVGDNVGMVSFGRFVLDLSSAMGGSGLNCTVPISDTAVHWDVDRAPKLFKLIAKDQTDKVGKKLCTKNGLPR